MHEPAGEEDIEHIGDPAVLKRMLMEKEQERQHLVANLDLAARLGLGLQQQLEQVELNSFAKLQSLQDQNMMLQSRANQAMELSSQLTGSEDEVKTLTGHNVSLQRELDSCRKDLKAFRRELDGLVEQMTEMGAEVVDAKSKVNSYSRRLGEVEQELSTTQELNVNLQVQLENALERQKQSHSTTAQVVKLIQSDLGKVVSESGMIRSTLEELENRQVKCEGKVVEMVTNTREYAHLLEEAQDTIHTLRQESDMEGRGWPHGSSVVKKMIEPARKYSTLAQENPELRNGLEEEEEEEEEEEQVEEDPELWSEPPGVNSLDTELKEEPEQDQSTNDHNWSDHQSMDAIASELKESTPPSSPASYRSKQTPASSPQAPVTKALPVDNQTQTDIIIPKIPLQKPSLSLSAELHQRLEEHSQQSALQGSSRPPWNPSVALENLAQAPPQRSPGSRSGGRSMSQSHMSPRSTGSRIGPSGMPSPHPSLSSSMSSLSEAIAGNRPRGASSFSSESGLKPLANSSVHPLEPSSITTKAKPKASTAPKKPAGLTGAASTRSHGGGDRAVTRRATSDDSTPASGPRTSRAPSRSRSTAPESKMLQSSLGAPTLSSSRSITPAGPVRQPPTPTTVAFGRTSKAPPSPSSSTSASGPRSTVASSGRTTPSPAPGPRSLTPSTSSPPSQPRASRATTSSKGSGSRRPSLTPTPIPESSLPPVPTLPMIIADAKSSD
ncbi:hypothetical protein CPC16_009601 [Podila verticillata]|nr:hypothetical protein CPC16_009601 [Podila verticillata]